MLIYPAMDLMDGQCVRLEQGDFDAKTLYHTSPFKQASAFKAEGAKWLHIVDLDGARNGQPCQAGLIAEIAGISGLKVQTGGGLRSIEDAKSMLLAGLDRVVVGSLAVQSPESVERLLDEAGPARISIALDVRIRDGSAFVVTHGWTETSRLVLDDALRAFAAKGAKHFLITDISRDGLLGGPNVALYRSLGDKFADLEIQASGGVSTLDDLKALAESGTKSVIIGKALYEKRFTLRQALSMDGVGDAG